jgi:hypothetical protein
LLRLHAPAESVRIAATTKADERLIAAIVGDEAAAVKQVSPR